MRNALLLSLLVFAPVFGLSTKALGQDVSTIVNTTNACINSTYRSWTPNMAAPMSILIDRRVTFNPLTLCTTAMSNNAGCARDGGTPMLLIATAVGTQLTMNPSCSWNCGVCGTIVTNGANNGLPVELLDFQVK